MCSAHVHIHIVTHIYYKWWINNSGKKSKRRKYTYKVKQAYNVWSMDHPQCWLFEPHLYTCIIRAIVMYTMCYRHTDYLKHSITVYRYVFNSLGIDSNTHRFNNFNRMLSHFSIVIFVEIVHALWIVKNINVIAAMLPITKWQPCTLCVDERCSISNPQNT